MTHRPDSQLVAAHVAPCSCALNLTLDNITICPISDLPAHAIIITTTMQMNDLQLSEHEYRWAYSAIDEVLPTDVHMAMVIPALEYQTSPEQRERWLPLAKSFKILGAYVQTELGHGSNVRALETTATYDVDTKEWVLHSPTLTSTKWWPGGLGKTATHAVRSVLIAVSSAVFLKLMVFELRALRLECSRRSTSSFYRLSIVKYSAFISNATRLRSTIC
jgi:Acyl-coenzyme A oxidase N-terminal